MSSSGSHDAQQGQTGQQPQEGQAQAGSHDAQLVELARQNIQLQQHILETLQAQGQRLETLAQKITNMELRQSETQLSSKEALRHASQYFQGELWSLCPSTLQSLLPQVLTNQTLGQGVFPLQADRRRGIYQVTQQWLQDRQLLSDQWHQGQVLLWIPEFQQLLIDEAMRQGSYEALRVTLQQYQDAELFQLQQQAPSINHQGRQPYSPEDNNGQ